jgi:hypothetical protein
VAKAHEIFLPCRTNRIAASPLDSLLSSAQPRYLARGSKCEAIPAQNRKLIAMALSQDGVRREGRES